MSNETENKISHWFFPELNQVSPNVVGAATFEPWLTVSSPMLSKEELAQEELLNKLELVKEKEASLHKSIQYLENMFTKLKNPFSVIEADIIETINCIVKKMTQRLIQKELAADPSIIVKVIDELKKNIPNNDAVVSIHVSMSDYKFLREHSMVENLYLPDPSLAPGDVVIKCDFSEVHAHVNTSIDNMMSIKHE